MNGCAATRTAAILLLASRLAFADGDLDAEGRAFFDVGVQAYAAGEYLSAIQAFEQAYRKVERPGLLFSIAQAHRRAYYVTSDRKHLDAAIERYRQYIARVPAGPRRADASRALTELEPIARHLAKDEVNPEGAAASGQSVLMISCSAPAALLSVDGDRVPRLPHVASMKPGTHTISVRAPGFEPHERKVELPAGGTIAVNIELRELPGLLRISGPSGAEVLLDGRAVGSLPLASLSAAAGWHALTFRKPGYQLASQELLVRRGEAQPVRLKLRTTFQRDAAWGFMGTGVAALGTSAILGIVSLVAEKDAKTLDDKRQGTGITSSEARDYEEARHRRDNFRVASAVVGGVGVGLVLTGAALYVLDAPAEPPSPSRERPPGSEPRSDWSAGLSPEPSGWTFSLRSRF